MMGGNHEIKNVGTNGINGLTIQYNILKKAEGGGSRTLMGAYARGIWGGNFYVCG